MKNENTRGDLHSFLPRFLIRFVFVVLLLSFAMVMSREAHALSGGSWYSQDWPHRRVIHLSDDTSDIPSTIEKFPLLIQIDNDEDISSNAQNSGNDLVFTLEDGMTKLSHELVSYDSVTGALTAYVLVPSFEVGDKLYLYYGNSTVGDQSDQNAVWADDFYGVWHLEETATPVSDSSSNNNTGDALNGTDLNVAGKVGGGAWFDGVDDYILTTYPASWSLDESFSMCTWFKPSSFPAFPYRQPILSKFPHEYSLMLEDNQINYMHGSLGMWIGGNLSLYTWYHVCVSYDGLNKVGRAYLNGSLTRTDADVTGLGSRTNPLELGAGYGWQWYVRSFFNGYMDEAFVIEDYREDDWFTALYNNQNSPETFAQVGHVVKNLQPGVRARRADESGTVVSRDGQVGQVEVEILDNSEVVASLDVDFALDRDWNHLNVNSNDKKALLHYDDGVGGVGFSSIPGAVGSGYNLFVPIPYGSESGSVLICPDVSSLSSVEVGCSDSIIKSESDTDVTKVTIDNKKYWKIEGLTGTGGMSIISNFDVEDVLSRLEISQGSDHTIKFGSVNGLTTSGDTIEIQFDPSSQGWDLSSIAEVDIDLEDDGLDKTLAATAGADIWGVSVNTTIDTITFTAPTSGTDYIDPNSILIVKIGTSADGGTGQVVNPSIAGEYEVYIKNTYGGGTGGIETAETEIPIVDDDTVNIHGYIDTVMSFDIDTAVGDVQCDAAGGVVPCKSHGGATDGAGYVVDLGELSLTSVNRSGDSVMHSDGLTGDINYIWFDLETNASSGAVVTVVSQYEALYKDASNQVSSVTTGSEQQILPASGLYGINHRSGFISSAAIGSMIVDNDCDASGGDDYYCDVADGGIPISIFNSNGLPVDDGRVQFAVGVAPDSADGTGTYTDQLTFIASASL